MSWIASDEGVRHDHDCALLMMNLGFFGVQFSFGLTQPAVNPLFLLIGAISDKTWSPRWCRRRPFVTGGALLCALILFVVPFVGSLGAAVREITDAVRVMPVAMHKIGVVFLFQWYAMLIYWQFLAVSLGETVFGATPEQAGPAWDRVIAWSGLENAAHNFVTMISALFLVILAQRMGAKRVHALALGIAALALIWLAQIDNQYLALVPMIGLGGPADRRHPVPGG